jgi:cyclophilin family peptidyl-prolyl cis-trans isomerase
MAFAAACALASAAVGAQTKPVEPAKPAGPAAPVSTAPIVVVETARGTFEMTLLPAVAPKSVAHILDLVRKNFYRGLRVHRVTDGLAQMGDPQTRNVSLEEFWGQAGSGQTIGVAEISKTQSHVRGAVGVAHSGNPKAADSQFYIMKVASPKLDGDYAIIGHVTAGMAVVDQLQVKDVIKNCYVKGEGPK